MYAYAEPRALAYPEKWKDYLEHTPRTKEQKRKDPILRRGYTVSILSPKPKEMQWKNKSVCPNCKTPVFFWTDGEPKNHFCWICHKEATL